MAWKAGEVCVEIFPNSGKPMVLDKNGNTMKLENKNELAAPKWINRFLVPFMMVASLTAFALLTVVITIYLCPPASGNGELRVCCGTHEMIKSRLEGTSMEDRFLFCSTTKTECEVNMKEICPMRVNKWLKSLAAFYPFPNSQKKASFDIEQFNFVAIVKRDPGAPPSTETTKFTKTVGIVKGRNVQETALKASGIDSSQNEELAPISKESTVNDSMTIEEKNGMATEIGPNFSSETQTTSKGDANESYFENLKEKRAFFSEEEFKMYIEKIKQWFQGLKDKARALDKVEAKRKASEPIVDSYNLPIEQIKQLIQYLKDKAQSNPSDDSYLSRFLRLKRFVTDDEISNRRDGIPIETYDDAKEKTLEEVPIIVEAGLDEENGQDAGEVYIVVVAGLDDVPVKDSQQDNRAVLNGEASYCSAKQGAGELDRYYDRNPKAEFPEIKSEGDTCDGGPQREWTSVATGDDYSSHTFYVDNDEVKEYLDKAREIEGDILPYDSSVDTEDFQPEESESKVSLGAHVSIRDTGKIKFGTFDKRKGLLESQILVLPNADDGDAGSPNQDPNANLGTYKLRYGSLKHGDIIESPLKIKQQSFNIREKREALAKPKSKMWQRKYAGV